MDFDQALAAHMAWKRKLSEYLTQRDGSLDPSEAALDNKCALGRWIYGEGSKFSRYGAYVILKKEHARFHEAVGDVIHRADSGESVSEDLALCSSSEFGKASSAVVLAIMDLKRQVSSL